MNLYAVAIYYEAEGENELAASISLAESEAEAEANIRRMVAEYGILMGIEFSKLWIEITLVTKFDKEGKATYATN